MPSLSLKQDELEGLYAVVQEIRDSARLQEITGLSYLGCINLKNKMWNILNKQRPDVQKRFR